MAETRDTTPVEVRLDRERMYRANEEDRRAVRVGPGRAKVPRWVADHLGLSYQAPKRTEPESEEDTEPETEVPTDNSDGQGGSTGALGLTDSQVQALRDAGFTSMRAIDKASDEELAAVNGIGDVSVKRIRAARSRRK